MVPAPRNTGKTRKGNEMNNVFKAGKRSTPLGAQGKADSLRGRMNHLLGTIQHRAGRLTGNRQMQARGAALRRKGTLQARLGWAKQKIHTALSRVRGVSRG